MEYYFFILLIFFLIDILIYRSKKINFFINCIGISLPIFLLINYVLFSYKKIDIDIQILIISNYFFFLLFYYFFFIGIKKISPTLFIINLLKTNIKSSNKIKNLFLKNNFFYSRVKENIDINLIKNKNNSITLTKKGIILISVIKILKRLLKV